MIEGKIIKLISDDFTVLSEGKTYICKCRGVFRKQKIKPVVGDNVFFNEETKIIAKIKPRKNELVRPPISNIDQAYIITSVCHPDFSSNLLDKLISVIEYNNIKPIIIFTKLDLLKDKKSMNIYFEYYKKIGYSVYLNSDLERIKDSFKNKISVFTGQTGAGKSTLLNNLDSNLNIRTNEISDALGRGKHTTRHVELIEINSGLVADTPGFSDVDLEKMNNAEIRDSFIEFDKFKEFCKYRDCMHDKEDNCEIKNKVKDNEILKSRYDNYLKFIKRG